MKGQTRLTRRGELWLALAALLLLLVLALIGSALTGMP